MKTAVYPGSFDPITNGHLDVLKRGLRIFDRIIVLVAVNSQKKSRFTPEERVEMIRKATAGMNGVEVDAYDGLTVEYAKAHDCHHLIRGLRAVTDFDYEFQIASANDYINKDVDTIFLMSKVENTFINSSTIMEMHKHGVDISKLVPSSVIEMLEKHAK